MSEGSDNGARVRLVDEGEAGLLARISERYHAAGQLVSDTVVDVGNPLHKRAPGSRGDWI
jgi:hypothetical protein